MAQGDGDDTPVTFLRGSVPEAVERLVHVLEHGEPLVCDTTWRDVVAVVEYGEIEVETPHGARLNLVQGDALSFALTGPVTVRAPDGLAVLAAVRHRKPPDPNTRTDPDKEHDMKMRLELVPIPVADVDRAKHFYTEKLGFHTDLDHVISEEMRVVQLTPPGSSCSINIGKGIITTPPGSVQGLHLVVDDIHEARAELAARGVDIGEVVAMSAPGKPTVSYAGFTDPDGNSWTLQQLPASE